MMEISVISKTGEDTGRKVTLADSIYGLETPNDHAIYLDVKQFLANQRQGTHKSKERGEIIGSTRKLKKQKGTGTARSGSIKSPVFRGGGRVFGPRPRNYGFKLNRKLKVLARKSALTYKAQEQQIRVVEDLALEGPKTKDYVSFLNSLEVNGKKTLLVLGSGNKNVFLSSRNLKKAKVMVANDLNTYDVLNADTLLLCESSVEQIENILNR